MANQEIDVMSTQSNEFDGNYKEGSSRRAGSELIIPNVKIEPRLGRRESEPHSIEINYL